MGKRRLMTVVVGLVLAMVASTGLADAVTNAADDLVADQIGSGGSAGSWPSEADFAGEPTIGLCHAYELTNDSAYKTAAENGGAYSLNYAGYNAGAGSFTYALFPAEAYAMARLSAIQATPAANQWRTALVDNMDAVDAAASITWYQNNEEDSSAVYSAARMAVSANYVVGEMEYPGDASVWRNGVITLLGDVDDSDSSPVMALGAAVWALASTGDISTDTTEVWTGVQVKDLPAMLAGRQAADGSFYATLGSDVGAGFTETTAMATLGLQAADASLYSSEIASAVDVLEGGVADPGGEVYWEIGESSSGAYYFAIGETLEVIPEPATMTMLLIGTVGLIRRRNSK